MIVHAVLYPNTVIRVHLSNSVPEAVRVAMQPHRERCVLLYITSCVYRFVLGRH